MEKLKNHIIELPEPKSPREAEAYDFARRLVEHVLENPVAFRNGINMGREIGISSRSHNPVKAIANNSSWKLIATARHRQYDSAAFNIGLVAGAASETE